MLDDQLSRSRMAREALVNGGCNLDGLYRAVLKLGYMLGYHIRRLVRGLQTP